MAYTSTSKLHMGGHGRLAVMGAPWVRLPASQSRRAAAAFRRATLTLPEADPPELQRVRGREPVEVSERGVLLGPTPGGRHAG